MAIPEFDLSEVDAVRSLEPPTMTKAVVVGFFAALADDDLTAAADLLDDAATFWVLSHRKAVPALAWLAGYRDMVRAPASGGVRFTVVTLTAEDDRVAAVVECRAAFDDGRVYDNRYHFLFEVAGARIARAWEFGDTLHSQQTFRAGQP